MKKYNKIFISSLFLAIGFIFYSSPVLAVPLPNPLACTDIPGCVKKAADFMFDTFLLFAVLVTLYAAFLFLTSAGNEEKIKKARRAILWIVIGIFIILIANGVALVTKEILGG